jgi:hypothetical protein
MMVKRTDGWDWLCGCLAVGLAAAVVPTGRASDVGAVAGARVELNSYRHYLDNELYTHYGDDRRYGPEHDLAQANIATILAGFGLSVTLELVPCPYAPGPFYNVVGTKLGTLDPTVEYVVGAHYDSACDFDCDDPGNPGADDNASGVALVLEAARVLSQYESDYTIRFVAFDREERPDLVSPGLYGALAYVADHGADDIRGVINADMVAYNKGTNAVGVGRSSASSDPLRDAMLQAVTAYGEGMALDALYVGPGDHQPFEDAGFQAVMVHEGLGGNPCYHRECDSVDTPGYIDYEYATRITRIVAGFLVDHAGVHVDIPDGDFNGDGNVDLVDYAQFEACIADPGIPVDPPCDFFDLDADGDVDCTDWRMFEVVWTGQDDPPTPWRCDLTPAIVAGDGCRCLEITPPQSQRPMALLLDGWPAQPDVSCVSGYVQSDGRLGSTPNFQAWDAWGTLHVCDAEILPESTYMVRCDIGDPGSPVLSVERSGTTGLWGDTAGFFVDGAWGPPNGDSGIQDIVAIVDAFKVLPGRPPIHRVDLVGVGAQGIVCRPDQTVDMLDALAAVDAFKGMSLFDSAACSNPCP